MSWLRCTVFFTFFIIYGVNPQNLLDYSVYPLGSGFLLTRPNSEADEKKVFLATASNTDGYEVTARIGPLARQAYFSGNRDLSEDPIQVLVHVVNQEVEEDTKTMNFLCHASSLQKSFRVPTPIRICCVISVNTTFSHEFTSCILELTYAQESVVCHAFIKLPAVLWKQKTAPSVTVSYTTLRISHVDNHNNNHSQCSAQVSFSDGFIKLPTATVVRSVPDAIREIGRSLLLQVPRRELRINEEFAVSVRLKRGDDVSDFTLRCEVPANSYVDFVRVIWPGGLKTTKEPNLDLPFTAPVSSAAHTTRSDGAVQNVWDIFHRSIVSQKRNVTEIVARFREDLARSETMSSYSPASEVYKLLFRVVRPPAGSPGRVAPRIFWSLVSLSRRNSPDRAVGGSPIVTRLNIESSELKYLAMVLKTSALVNVAALTGRPSTHPVWVYGLTHDGQLIDVTDRATCHTGDDAVIHFANDSCSKLGFSGAELDGSPGLPLVAKMDGRSATTTLLVWFPKPPALRLVIGPETAGNSSPNIGLEKVTPIRLKRLATEIASSHSTMDYERSWSANRTSETFFQHLSIRVLARFILAGSVLYDKDVLGGKIDQYVDVTEYTAHRLRLVHNSSEDNSTSTGSAELVMIYRNDHLRPAEPKSSLELISGQPNLQEPLPGPSHVWLIGNHPGLIHLRLETLDATALRAAIPPGLEKQLKDQQQKTSSNASDLENLLRSSKSNVQLAVEITEETSVWPIGMSAQFVTDVRVKMRQSFDPGLPWDAHQTSLFRGHSNLQPNEEILPLTSGLYGIQLDLLGGRMMHSGTIHKSFGHETNLDGSDHLLNNHFRGSSRSYLLNASRAAFPRPKSSDSSGLIIVWIHLSDGSIILWHRMVELYQAMNKDMPFRLSINNLHPEVFEVTGSSIVLVDRKRRGRSASLAALDRRVRYLNENRFSRPTPRIAYGQKRLHYSSQMRFQSDSTQLDDSSPPSFADHLMSNEHTGATWSGPTVWIRRDGLSFTGDVLEMGLLSASGELLVPKLRLPANIVTPKPANDAQEFEKSPVTGRQNSQVPLTSDRTDKTSGFPTGSSPDQITNNQFDSGSKKYTSFQGGKSINAEIEETNHGLMAFKDAPGYRGHQIGLDRSVMTGDKGIVESNHKVPYAGPLHEKSLSDQNEESKPALSTSPERHQNSLDGQQGTGDGSRPALEMSMYILLGLFALVGLVFAVNCGAAVARYRWERSSRRRSANSSELVQQSPSNVADQPIPNSEGIPKEFTENALEAECKPIIDKGSTENVLERCKRFILPRRPKRKPLLHRDNNWVWISREKAVEVIGVSDQSTLSVSLGNPIAPNSPILTNSVNEVHQVAGTGEQRKIARSQSYGTRHGTTTAVLSVGEADMLLLHSPYHKSTWQDSLRPGTARVASYVDRSIHNTPVSFVPKFVPRSPWDSEEPQAMETSEVHTLGRPFRHHTTETLMQRNYQGQECSIRIISNPLSEGNGGNRSDPSSQRNSEHERSSYQNTSERPSKEVWFHATNRTLMGSASTSIRRRRTYNMNNSNWDSSASPLMCAGQATLIDSNREKVAPIGGSQPPLFSFPNQTAPLKLGDHMTVAYGDAVMHETMMCRSWVRPRSINQTPKRDIGNTILHDTPAQHTPVQNYSSPWHARHAQPVNKTNPCASNQVTVDQMEARTSVPIKERFSVLDQLRESRELGQVGNSFLPVDHAPYPPVRTTSKAANCRTLETRGGARKSHSAPNHRPMSLPQAFQVSNDLYSILAGNTTSTSASLLLDSHSQLNETDSQRHLKSNPSEESLWWYHPVRQPRRRKRRQDNKQSVTSQKPTASGPTSMETAEETVRPMDRVDSSETLDYACPASCECDNIIKCSERVDSSRGPHLKVHSPSFQGGESTHANASSISELAWDKELLALSHDRLVAYFAGMKESMA
ncbi:hypothetical protein CRM22_005623 [Opisthorchis felineus]|uniref:Transmembrane protein family 132 fourth domain-containing protein n=1 Tax=Opisthorchis felineus TaxID=147828 RepID=A0A4S2LQ97_OPIFE|nr:hypothetical protein CRM22_005623 [Opisthorchis felineus]